MAISYKTDIDNTYEVVNWTNNSQDHWDSGFAEYRKLIYDRINILSYEMIFGGLAKESFYVGDNSSLYNFAYSLRNRYNDLLTEIDNNLAKVKTATYKKRYEQLDKYCEIYTKLCNQNPYNRVYLEKLNDAIAKRNNAKKKAGN